MRKEREVIIGIEERHFYSNKLSYSLAVHGWLLSLSSERESAIISPCGQDGRFPVSFTESCL